MAHATGAEAEAIGAGHATRGVHTTAGSGRRHRAEVAVQRKAGPGDRMQRLVRVVVHGHWVRHMALVVANVQSMTVGGRRRRHRQARIHDTGARDARANVSQVLAQRTHAGH